LYASEGNHFLAPVMIQNIINEEGGGKRESNYRRYFVYRASLARKSRSCYRI
jgi:hypothetical protein